jgi:hypothetical protein
MAGKKAPSTLAMTGLNQLPISLTANAAGPRVLAIVPDPIRREVKGEELLIEARAAVEVDIYTGLAVRASIEQHLLEDTQATVCPWLPQDEDARRRLLDLLGPLPERCSLPDDHRDMGSDPRIIVPVTSVEDYDRAGLVASTILQFASSPHRGRLRIAAREARFLAGVAMALLDNALLHSRDSTSAPFIACAMKPGTRDVQLAVYDLGTGISHCSNPRATIDACLKESSQDPVGGISYIAAMAKKRGYRLTIQVRSGSASARWSGSWKTKEAGFSPGFAAGIELQIADF